MSNRAIAIPLLLLVLVSMFTSVQGEEIRDRINRFKQKYSENRIEALKILVPVDHPKIVDALAQVYADENTNPRYTYDATYFEADIVMETLEGEDVFERVHYYLTPNRPYRTRQRFIRALGPHKHASTLPVFAKMAPAEKDEKIQFEFCRALVNFSSDDALILMYKLAVKSLSVNNSLQAFQGLKKYKNDSTSELMLKLYKNKKVAGEIRGECLTSLFERKFAGIENEVKNALADKATGVRVAALFIVIKENREDLGSQVISMITAPEWEVRSAAVRACGVLKLTKSVGPLIALWENEGGRIGEDIHKALMKITGKSLGPDYRYWKAWFENLEEPVKKGDKEGEYISYHGLKTKSKNIAFVIDTSGSMIEKVKAKNAGGYLGEGAEVKGDTKLDYVKAELIRVIKSLPKDTKFNIVAFEATIKSWNKAQVFANKKNKEKAIKWVNGLRASGQTNCYDAIVEAFGRMNPGGKPNKHYKAGGPDTIFVLSDGLPNSGSIADPTAILKAVKDLNKVRQVTIHTIGVGQMTKMFLEPLAKQNNGKFKLIAK